MQCYNQTRKQYLSSWESCKRITICEDRLSSKIKCSGTFSKSHLSHTTSMKQSPVLLGRDDHVLDSTLNMVARCSSQFQNRQSPRGQSLGIWFAKFDPKWGPPGGAFDFRVKTSVSGRKTKYLNLFLFHECMPWPDAACHEWSRRLISIHILSLGDRLCLHILFVGWAFCS